MKILMLHPYDVCSPWEPSGVRIKYIAEELYEKGNEVKLVYFLDRRYPRSSYNFSDGNGYEEIGLYRDRRYLPKNIYRVAELSGWSDIIHFQKCYYTATLPALFAGLFKNKPLHYDWDDWEEKIYAYSSDRPFKLIEFYFRVKERFIPKIVDTISVASHSLYNLCLSMGVDKERIFFSPTGANLQKFKPSVTADIIRAKYNIRGTLVIYHGVLVAAHYANMLVESARILKQRGHKIYYMLIGPDREDSFLKEMIERYNLKEQVILVGPVEHKQIPNYINAADIAVAPFEDNEMTRCKCPLKIPEYMALAKPIVASDVGEVRHMLDSAGILVEPGSSLALAEGIEKLLLDKELRETLGKKARALVEKKYNWSNTADNLLMAYQKAISLHNLL